MFAAAEVNEDGTKTNHGTVPLYNRGKPPEIASRTFVTAGVFISMAAINLYATRFIAAEDPHTTLRVKYCIDFTPRSMLFKLKKFTVPTAL